MITKLKHFYTSTHNNVFVLSALNISLYSAIFTAVLSFFDVNFSTSSRLVIGLLLILNTSYSVSELFQSTSEEEKELNFLKTSLSTGLVILGLMILILVISMF